MRVSVVLPAHDNRHALPICLAAFATQTYPRDRFEVIVADDASTDGTPAIVPALRLPYRCKVIELRENRGAATARNRGLEAAEGELIIFVDADTVAPPEFIARHVECQQGGGPPLLVSGAARWLPLYTCLYPDVSPGHLRAVEQMIQRHPWVAERLPERWKEVTAPHPLARVEDILAGRTAAFHVPPDWPGFMHEVVAAVGERLDAFPTGWMACIGRNFSVRRDLVRSVGGFDPDFRGYGQQDWELGYRLQRQGVGILCTERVVNYHQEHPASAPKRIRSNLRNYRLFSEKHRGPELDFFAVCQVADQWGPLRLGELFTQYRQARRQPGLGPLTQLFADLASEYRHHYLAHAQEPPRSTCEDRMRTWPRDRLRQVERARRILAKRPDALPVFRAGLATLMTAAPDAVAPKAPPSGPQVLHLSGWPSVGGVTAYIRDACVWLRETGGRPLVAGPKGPAEPMLQAAAGTFLRFGRDVDHRATPEAQARALASTFEPGQIHVVHCHRAADLPLALRLADTLRCRLVVTIHGWNYGAEPLRAAWQRADHILFASAAVAGAFVRRHGAPAGSHSVCPPGVDTDRFRPGRRDGRWLAERGIPADRPLIAYVGPVDWENQSVPARLIRSTPRLRAQCPTARIVVAGPGAAQLRSIAETAAAERGEPVAHLLDDVTDLVPMYRAAGVVVGSGRAAMEALACGRPVVAQSAAGAVGLLTPQTSAQAVETYFAEHGGTADADTLPMITDILSNPGHRADLVRFGRGFATARLGLEAFGRGLRRAYGDPRGWPLDPRPADAQGREPDGDRGVPDGDDGCRR